MVVIEKYIWSIAECRQINMKKLPKDIFTASLLHYSAPKLHIEDICAINFNLLNLKLYFTTKYYFMLCHCN